LCFANQLHAGQTRKGSQTPYIAHLLSVAALVLECGGDEDEVIAALLHDAVEDQGGQPTLALIQARFGARVAGIVAGCTDTDASPKPPWQERKRAYLAHLPHSSPEVRRVSLADKLHNARCLLRDLRREGLPAFDKFNGGQAGTLWYYHSLVQIFQELENNFMSAELARVVNEIQQLVAQATDAASESEAR
jgi:(p)ppGpp synthase/HD superfamily hydrolase